MKVSSAGVLAMLFLCSLHAAACAQRRGGRGSERQAVENGWVFSLQEGKAQARKAGKPLMVVVRCVP